jgi:cyclase
VRVPLIASGGAGSPAHFPPAVDAGADAVLAASILHFGDTTVPQIKEELDRAGHEVR